MSAHRKFSVTLFCLGTEGDAVQYFWLYSLLVSWGYSVYLIVPKELGESVKKSTESNQSNVFVMESSITGTLETLDFENKTSFIETIKHTFQAGDILARINQEVREMMAQIKERDSELSINENVIIANVFGLFTIGNLLGDSKILLLDLIPLFDHRPENRIPASFLPAGLSKFLLERKFGISFFNRLLSFVFGAFLTYQIQKGLRDNSFKYNQQFRFIKRSVAIYTALDFVRVFDPDFSSHVEGTQIYYTPGIIAQTRRVGLTDKQQKIISMARQQTMKLVLLNTGSMRIKPGSRKRFTENLFEEVAACPDVFVYVNTSANSGLVDPSLTDLPMSSNMFVGTEGVDFNAFLQEVDAWITHAGGGAVRNALSIVGKPVFPFTVISAEQDFNALVLLQAGLAENSLHISELAKPGILRDIISSLLTESSKNSALQGFAKYSRSPQAGYDEVETLVAQIFSEWES